MRDANTTTAAGADTRSEAEPGRRREQARPGKDVLDGLTAEQTPCVEHVSGPLVVSAGAGSGKTFMLTRRIAYALLHPEESGVTSVDQILAITFTELAASQIKARTRSMLTSLGMQDQALKVDSSWISTIHGACSRILHEQALGLGLDPAFGILDDARKDALVQESINEALEAAGLLERPSARSEDGTPVVPTPERGDDAGSPGAGDGAGGAGAGGVDRSFADLYREYGSSSQQGGVARMLRDLLDATRNVPGGLSAVDWGPEPRPARQAARDLLDRARDLDAACASLAGGKKVPKFCEKVFERLEGESGAIATLESLSALDSTTHRDLARALCATNLKFGRAPSDDAVALANAELRMEAMRAADECVAALLGGPRGQLMDLARRTERIYEGKKRRLHLLDQDDLLTRTLAALQGNEAVRDAYRDRFALVMVDEFQDTSQLQIEIIDQLCGKGRERLCTVGDAQQSIYAFRGADVATYLRHKEQTAGMPGTLSQTLSRNFRSHPAIISFVNRVFSQPQVFGGQESGQFIELDTPEGRTSRLAGRPRPLVDVVATTYGYRVADKATSRAVLAHEVCRRFLDLHEQGNPWGDMVILLGRMGGAQVFADELRAHGVPCVISGGSIFADAPEAQAVCDLACAVANPLDDGRMQRLLGSDMFGLSPDELLRLATAPDGRGRGYWRGLRDEAGSTSARVRLARSVLGDAVRDAGTLPPSRILTDALLASGWLDRLSARGPEGTAECANVLKAVRMAASLERDAQAPAGMAGVAASMGERFAQGMKEAPGALNAANQDAVKIMTIHASKGLEFPIVALAEFYEAGGASRSQLVTKYSGGRLLAALKPGALLASGGGLEGLSKVIGDDYDGQYATACRYEAFEGSDDDEAVEDGLPELARGASGFRRALARRVSDDDLAEMRRKFYVGSTRPEEMLIVAVGQQVPTERSGSRVYSNDIVEDLRLGLGLGENGEQSGFPSSWSGPLPPPRDDGRDAGPSGEDERVRMSMSIENIELSPSSEGDGLVDALVGGTKRELGEYLGEDLPGAREAPAADGARVPEPIDVAALVPPEMPAGNARSSEFSYSSVSTNGKTYTQLLRGRRGSSPRGGRGTAAAGGGTAAPRDADRWQADADDVRQGREAQAELDDEDAGLGGVVIVAGRQVPGTPVRAPGGAGGAVTPTAFGSTFHSCAQWMAERLRAAREGATGLAGSSDALEVPDESRLSGIARAWGLDDASLPRLRDSLRRWAGSDVAREALSRPTLMTEVPIYVSTLGPQGEPLYLNGTIDLLGYDASRPVGGQRALVVDYKTGGSPSEECEDLLEKHRLQSLCYALGTLRQGFAGVDMRFVRVEVPERGTPAGDIGQPQVVRYAYEATQADVIESAVRDAYRAARARA
ncbi:MAG: UvrD-helicase domain-containing protein [Coriobacteriales bacterium]|jgi:ATP-dependent helicase/nuclease subunit A